MLLLEFGCIVPPSGILVRGMDQTLGQLPDSPQEDRQLWPDCTDHTPRKTERKERCREVKVSRMALAIRHCGDMSKFAQRQ